ncbi:MAG: flippase-like domain-containing protein [Lachnospiraceae bacterium]|nr:flippase-like domain-containing protein [Lachnospiraceae bacterium]
MKKRTNKRTGTDGARTGSKLYRKRIARENRTDASLEQSFDGVLEPVGVLTEGEDTIIGTGTEAAEAGVSCPVATPPKISSGRRTALWIVLSFGIALLSIWAVTSQNKHFRFSAFLDRISNSNKAWLACAVLAMLGFIFFEALSFRTILRSLGYRRSLFANYTYAATDIYFSAITPSATGGQPASAYIMMHSGGISGSVTTVTILVALAMYALSIIILGLVCFLFRPALYFSFSTLPRIMIIIGVAVQVGLALMFVLLIQRGQLLCKLACKLLPLAAKLHLVRNPERRAQRLQESLNNYRLCAEMTAGKKQMLLRVLVYNVLQRASQIAVTVFAYLAMGGKVRNALDIFAIQSYTILGAAYVPVPGGMGVIDMMLSDGLGGYMPEEAATELTLLSRSISFYACILLCGFTVLMIYLVQKLRGKKLR